jgi:hypothetical protein
VADLARCSKRSGAWCAALALDERRVFTNALENSAIRDRHARCEGVALMKTVHALLPCSLLLVVLAACSGSSDGTGPAADGGSSAKGSQTAPGGASSAPSGKACSAADDCAYWFCECKDGAIVNSRSCTGGSCQAPAEHCPSACATFGHGAWTGQASGGDTSASSSSSSSSSSSGGGSLACGAPTDCASFSCGCTDGARLTTQSCVSGVCQNASTGCENACLDDGQGDWDGT